MLLYTNVVEYDQVIAEFLTLIITVPGFRL